MVLEKIQEEKVWEDNRLKEMDLSLKDEYHFKRATHCYICKKDFVENSSKSESKIIYHDHFTGYDTHIIFNNLNVHHVRHLPSLQKQWKNLYLSP